MKSIIKLFIPLLFLGSCNSGVEKADPEMLTDPNLLHGNMKQLTEVIIYDVFSPPVASRIYSYASLAAYEAVKFQEPEFSSIASKLNGFPAMPEPEHNKSYNFLLASTKAFFTVAEKITFSKDTLAKYQHKIYKDFKSLLDKETFDRSIAFGEAVGKSVLERTNTDNYKETRGMSKFLGSHEEGKWRPTPPDYMDGAEPHWGKMKPLFIDSANQFRCPAPPSFNLEKNSPFYKQVNEVYTIGKNLTEEQKDIAKYWDDNPFVIEHSGHLMFANKKITPVGHWIGITSIAGKMKNLSAVETARAYVLTSTAIFDTFISCWFEKYTTEVIRPVTVINEYIDQNWQPYLQTPPFPEYSSGHSGISAAAATVLTKLFGENFAFEDTSDLEYIGMKRNFKSFHEAAQEVNISRVYGGIHYKSGVGAGAMQGKEMAEYLIKKLDLE
ncbi:MAG: vanadium-dependent haloperoxidase [Bacteroidota bacterium]|nr:vanadium-dependent haloperoxidase [Bacteroidota bacterium]